MCRRKGVGKSGSAMTTIGYEEVLAPLGRRHKEMDWLALVCWLKWKGHGLQGISEFSRANSSIYENSKVYTKIANIRRIGILRK